MNDITSVSPARLRSLFHPRSIALVGATDNSRWSLSTFSNLKTYNYPGPIYCVNPKYEQVHGEPAFKRLRDIPQPVDLAYVMVPTHLVYPIMEEAASVGIKNLVILTAGFSEMGTKGQQLEQQILEFAQRHQMTMLGPNGNGFVNVATQTLPYGLPVVPPLVKGPVGIVLQSGGLASYVMTMAQTRYIGLSLMVSVGNETMISVTDVMNYLIEDENTKVIAVFLESIRSPEAFKRVARRALEHKKPIVALKIGKSDVSARAAMAHTGALVGDNAVNDAMFKQLGITRVGSLEDLIMTSGMLGYGPALSGRRAGFVTPSGGACDILSDRAHDEGIELPQFAPQTMQGLRNVLPDFSNPNNPLDVTGYIVVDRTLQQRSLEVVMQDPGIDFILFLTEPPRLEPAPALLDPMLEQYDLLSKVIRESRLPIVVLSNTCIDITPFGRTLIDRTGIHFAGGMEHGMTALGHTLRWYENQPRLTERWQQHVPVAPIPLDETPSGSWSEFKARTFLQAHGIPVAPGTLASNAQEAVAAAEAFGFPVALKVQSDEILHKSDIGGVLLNIASEDGVRRGFDTIMKNVSTQSLSHPIDGILVSPMRPTGIELLVGIIQDPLWGQVLAVGLGGIWVEVFKDTSVRVLPVQRDEIKDMLSELHGAAILRGTRGQPPVDIERLIDVIFQVTQVAQGLQDHLESLEINPLLIHNTSIEALDALMTWKKG